MSYETILYGVDGAVATITLNRPERLNTIVPPLPAEVQDAVTTAVRDRDVKVIVVRGAGRSFCAGYDFAGGFDHWEDQITQIGCGIICERRITAWWKEAQIDGEKKEQEQGQHKARNGGP